MKVAAITITFNRLELTKRTLESFYSKTKADYHLFIDNGSTDGTVDFIKGYDRILLDQNFGIARAFAFAVSKLNGYDYILKLDNDVEIVTDNLVEKMVDFLETSPNYVVSPVDQMIDPNFYPHVFKRLNINRLNIEETSHTGGAFQLGNTEIIRSLCNEFKSLAKGDYMIGDYYRKHGYKPAYLTDLKMNHIGLNQSTPGNLYIM